MPRSAKVWWNKQRGAWCTDLGGKRHVLAKGRANKRLAKERLAELVNEQALLADVNGAITVAAMCDAFLDDALHNLEKRTYKSYQYGCQKLVDMYAARADHLTVAMLVLEVLTLGDPLGYFRFDGRSEHLLGSMTP